MHLIQVDILNLMEVCLSFVFIIKDFYFFIDDGEIIND